MKLRNFSRPAFAISAAAILSLSACGKPSNSTAVEPAGSNSAVSSGISNSSAAGYPSLIKVIENTQGAVYAKDFDKAKQEFDQFEPAWKEVEDGVKQSSSKTYDDVEQGMESVSKAIRAKDAVQATDALKAMNAHILSAS